MIVFLSWSGELSHKIASSLTNWLPQLINAVKPWLSSQDIEKGSRWFEEIGNKLSEADFGVLCLTAANIGAPWILFEAGALSKSLGQAKVCPLLVDIANSDLAGPLAQFNTTGISRDEIWKLVQTINSRLDIAHQISETQLNVAFEVWWPRLEVKFKDALISADTTSVSKTTKLKRTNAEIFEELLDLSRSVAQQVARLSSAAKSDSTTAGQSAWQLAHELDCPISEVLNFFSDSGFPIFRPDDTVSSELKARLLDHLHKPSGYGGGGYGGTGYGGAGYGGGGYGAAPKTRKIEVEIRKKRTFVKRDPPE